MNMSKCGIPFNKDVHAYRRGLYIYFLHTKKGSWAALPVHQVKCLLNEYATQTHSEAYGNAYEILARAAIIDNHDAAHVVAPCEKKPFLVKFQTTGECNLKCVYCFNDPRIRSNVMEDSVMKKSVDYVFSHPQSAYGVEFIIYGGEPLAQRELLYNTICYIRQTQSENCPTTVGIITNGTLATPEDAQFFKKYKVRTSVSFDGMP